MKKLFSNGVALSLLILLITLNSCKKNSSTAPLARKYDINISTNASLGQYLTNKNGLTLYTFANDADGVNTCTGGCEAVWPAFTTDLSNARLDAGLISTDFATITNSNGMQQVTYKGWPLYTYSPPGNGNTGNVPEKPDSITGDGIGGVWFVAKPDYTIMLANKQLTGLDGNMYKSDYTIGAGQTTYFTDSAGRTLYTFIVDSFNINKFTKPDLSNNNVFPVYEQEIKSMNNALAHRGPDGEGIFVENNIGLGHRRLAILDVSNKEPDKDSNAFGARLNYLLSGIADLSPDYFALVMATGIVSIAAHLFNYTLLAKSLFYINAVAYVIICILFIARFIFYKKEFLSDFLDDRKNMGFLSFVAANCILGSQFILIANNYNIAIYFFAIGLSSWTLLIYSLFAIIIEKSKKPTIKVISGRWLLLVVATQSISILSVQLEGHLPIFHGGLLFLALTLFLCGCMFYIIIITLIVYRLIFFSLHAEELGPPYWINMGADAISVLAGSSLILSAEKWQFLSDILPFLKGYTLLFWAIGTWWIPLMLILGVWRHIIKRVPLKYNSQYWGLVFPLGMYTVCTIMLSQAIDLPFLMAISSVFIPFAIGAWVIVFIGLISAILHDGAKIDARERLD